MKLVIGTGADWQKKDGVIGLDIIPEFNPDVVRDILRGLPFDDDKFDEIEIEHVLEHISGHLACRPTDNFDFVMNEMHRVLKPGGLLRIETPYWHDEHAVESAGHVRFFNEFSFINYYQNPYGDVMGQKQFSKVVSYGIFETDRSANKPSRVVRVVLQK